MNRAPEDNPYQSPKHGGAPIERGPFKGPHLYVPYKDFKPFASGEIDELILDPIPDMGNAKILLDPIPLLATEQEIRIGALFTGDDPPEAYTAGFIPAEVSGFIVEAGIVKKIKVIKLEPRPGKFAPNL